MNISTVWVYSVSVIRFNGSRKHRYGNNSFCTVYCSLITVLQNLDFLRTVLRVSFGTIYPVFLCIILNWSINYLSQSRTFLISVLSKKFPSCHHLFICLSSCLFVCLSVTVPPICLVCWVLPTCMSVCCCLPSLYFSVMLPVYSSVIMFVCLLICPPFFQFFVCCLSVGVYLYVFFIEKNYINTNFAPFLNPFAPVLIFCFGLLFLAIVRAIKCDVLLV